MKKAILEALRHLDQSSSWQNLRCPFEAICESKCTIATVFRRAPVLFLNWKCWRYANSLGLMRLIAHESYRQKQYKDQYANSKVSKNDLLLRMYDTQSEVECIAFAKQVLGDFMPEIAGEKQLLFFERYLHDGGDVVNCRLWNWLSSPRRIPYTRASIMD